MVWHEMREERILCQRVLALCISRGRSKFIRFPKRMVFVLYLQDAIALVNEIWCGVSGCRIIAFLLLQLFNLGAIPCPWQKSEKGGTKKFWMSWLSSIISICPIWLWRRFANLILWKDTCNERFQIAIQVENVRMY